MRTSQIKRIASLVDFETTPKTIQQVLELRVRKYKLTSFVKAIRRSGSLSRLRIDKKPYPLGFGIYVSLLISPTERLHTFFHEILHIIYHDKGIPDIEDLRLYKQKNLLETLVDESAEKFISINKPFCEKLFEIKFGIRHTDFWEDE